MEDLLPSGFFMPKGHPTVPGLRALQAKPAPAPRTPPPPANGPGAPPPKPAPGPANGAPPPEPAPGTAPTTATRSAPPTIAKPVTFLAPAVCSNPVTSAPMTSARMCALSTQIYADLDALLRTYSDMQKAQLFGSVLRVAFHDAGEALLTSSTDKLGPDGCLSLTPDNAGLIESTKIVSTVIQPWWQRYCAQGISRGDFWALLAKAVTERSSALGGASVRVAFFFGRKDALVCDAGAGRLPSASATSTSTTQASLLSGMGLTTSDVVTLLGAHSVGHASIANSGFGNPSLDASLLESNSWDQTPHILDNQYFVQLVTHPWNVVPPTTSTKQFYADLGSRGHLMLNPDMSLAFQIGANVPPLPAGASIQNKCGGAGNPCARTASTQALIDSYIASNAAFVSAFAAAMTKMSNVGYSYGTVTGGKLGTLSPMTC